ncbi:MAG: cation transporter [Desulfurococcales archaeon]|nr:cation transporter [Desulfurococcales archaeon]
MRGSTWVLPAILALSVAGAAVKSAGAFLYGSRSLFVDSLTCFANLVAVAATTHFYRVSLEPPDIDHHFGHYRLGYGGTIVSMLAYAFVAGIAVSTLLQSESYEVHISATWMAVAGLVLYSGAIFLAHKFGSFLKAYAVFTVSEVIESLVVVAASSGGALVNYRIDLAGAAVITAYIFIELYGTGKNVITCLSDVAPPPHFVERVKEVVESHGFRLVSVKLRKVSENLTHGDLVLRPEGLRLEEAVKRTKDVKELLKKEFNLDCSVELTI